MAPPFTLCAAFNLFPDNTQLPDEFVLSGFRFRRSAGGHQWFVNKTANVLGLQFEPNGGTAVLPTPVNKVEVRVGTFGDPGAAPVQLTVEDAQGVALKQIDIPNTNSYQDVTMDAPNIASLKFSGGGHEGVIEKICVTVTPC
jgi:hypothetical protein